MPVGQGEFVYLETNQADFTTASRIVEAVNLMLGADTATAVDSRRVRVKAPIDSSAARGFRLQAREHRDHAGDTLAEGDHQRTHRLGGDEPGSCVCPNAPWRMAACRW